MDKVGSGVEFEGVKEENIGAILKAVSGWLDARADLAFICGDIGQAAKFEDASESLKALSL